MSALQGIADGLAEAEHVAVVPRMDIDAPDAPAICEAIRLMPRGSSALSTEATPQIWPIRFTAQQELCDNVEA
jgi:hypothetical protein